MAKNQIEITPHGFGSLTQEELHQMAVLLIKAGYVDVGITRNQPLKGRPYIYTLKARRSVSERDEKETEKDS